MDLGARPVTIDDLLSHAEWVRALARHLVADPDEADDVAQDAWVAALRRRPPHAGNLRAWFARVVRRRAADRRRAAGRRARHEALLPAGSGAPDPAELCAQVETRTRIATAVLALPEPYRSTVLLRTLEGLEPAAIARLHTTPVETVRTRLRRGMALRRERLRAGEPEGRARLRAVAGLGTGTGALFVTTKTKAAVVLLLLAGGAVWWAPGGGDRRATEGGPASAGVARDGGDDGSAPRLAGRADGDGPPAVAAPVPPAPEDGLVAYPALARAPARIEGAVREADFAPAAGASVEARSSAGAEFALLRVHDERDHARSVEADADGRFVFDGLLEGPYLVRARRGESSSPWRLAVARAAPTSVDLWLEEAGAQALGVRVLDAAGRPVAGATVEAFVVGDGRAPIEPGAAGLRRSAISDAEGRAVWPGLGGAAAVVFARAPDGRIGACVVPARRGALDRRGGDGDLVVGPAGTVEGRVTTPDGHPAEGVRVLARLSTAAGYSYGSGASQTWEAPVDGGRFTLGDLPAGTFVLLALGPEWTTALEWREDDRYPATTGVEVAAGARAHVDLVLESGGAIEGRVLGPAGPVPGAWVRVVRDPRTPNEPDGVNLRGTNVWRLDYSFLPPPDDPLTHWTVPVGADGRYRVAGLRAGSYRLEATAPGHTFVQRVGETVTRGETLVRDVRLERAGVLQGAAPGKSYLGVRRPGADTCEEVAILPPSGLFTFPGLAAGEHELVMVYWGWETTVVGRATVVAGRTTWVDLWNVGEHGAAGRLRVRGEPLVGASVGRGWGEDAVRTDAQGRFGLRWPRPGGDAVLRVTRTAPGGRQSWQVRGLPLSRTGETELGDVELGAERLDVEVVDADGRPLSTQVHVTGPWPAGEGDHAVDLFVEAHVRTGPDGRVGLDGLPAATGFYRVEAKVAGVGSLQARTTVPSAPVRLAAPRTVPLRVVVRKADGAPAAGAHVSVTAWTDRREVPVATPPGTEEEFDPHRFALGMDTDADGRAEFPAVPVGAVLLVSTEDTSPAWLEAAARARTWLLLTPDRTREEELVLR